MRDNEQIWSGIASSCYIVLLFIVVSTNAQKIIALKTLASHVLSIEVALNLFGYSLAFLTRFVSKQQDTFLPILFLVGSKEFGIASAAVETMRLNTALVIPSAFYASKTSVLPEDSGLAGNLGSGMWRALTCGREGIGGANTN